MKYQVLFCNENSNYKKFESIFDIYSKELNPVENFRSNGYPVIAHPPCRLFSRMRKFSTANESEKIYAYWSLNVIRGYGGILEHPRSSLLWKEEDFNLDGTVDKYGGFLRSVNLSWFGYPAEKKTMLYFVGISPNELPEIPLSFNAITHIVSTNKKTSLPEIPKKRRSETPVEMIKYFIEVLRLIKTPGMEDRLREEKKEKKQLKTHKNGI